jgi:cell division protein YceG involved in septum cleavage
MKNKKAQVTMYITFFILTLVLITIFSFIVPMGVKFNSVMYVNGEKIIISSNQTISEIQDAEIKAQIIESNRKALAATQNNIEINNALYQYGWVFLLLITLIVIFLQTRLLVEVNRGGVV